MKRALSLTTLAAALAVAFATAGCGIPAPIEPRMDPYPQGQLGVAGKDLKKRVVVGIPIVERNESGIVVATLPVRNTTDQTLHLDYQVVFLNKNTGQVEQSPWKPVVIEQRLTQNILFNSMTPEASDFQLNLRYSK